MHVEKTDAADSSAATTSSTSSSVDTKVAKGLYNAGVVYLSAAHFIASDSGSITPALSTLCALEWWCCNGSSGRTSADRASTA
jgi:hypothetical protein